MNRRIDATTQNPQRERMLFGPLVQMNLRKHIKQLKKESAWKNQDHNSITIYKSNNATIVLRGMHKKSERKHTSANGDATIQFYVAKFKLLQTKKPTP